ncbi:alpha/beta fold hydrolase [Actinoplanes sp. L3-i22]|uniref:alpha/beta fold hydrolase n=1 Tax=Actinoplanes sp. L3-i22 TaxID=2836373 RepID=UPI001C76831C|nr:alpha/beta hydrolase [Actinoplanes sp. L3-i22]BCY10637.1 hydrolase [Actinoplanes sp. L3-i22]
MTITTHRISVGGVPQVYHVAGTGPICVAHSGGPGIDWAYLRMPLLERHFTMVYPEPVGTGDSGRLDGYDLAGYVEFVDAVVAALGVPRVFLLGHSHGGFVVQQYALDHPERVAGLALYDTSPVTGPEFWDAAMAGVIAYGAVDPAIPAAFERAVTATDDAVLSAALREAVPVYFADFPGRRAEFAQFVAGVRAWAVPQDAKPFDVRARLGEITVPTVIIVGEHDFICGPAWAAMLHAGIPGSRLVTLTSSGHFGHVEQPAEFAAAVTALLG